MLKKLTSYLAYIIVVACLGFAIFHFFLGPQSKDGGNQSTDALFAASFPDEKNQTQSLKQYFGKIIVLNFWATWCEPCREEMPELSQLHTEHQANQVVVLGIAIDDVDTVAEFLKDTPVSYPIFAADMQGMDIATALGNDKSVLPYTVIIRPDGGVEKIFFGRVTKPLLEKTLNNLF